MNPMINLIISILILSLNLSAKEKSVENNTTDNKNIVIKKDDTKEKNSKKDDIEEEQKFELTTLNGKTIHIQTKPNGLNIKELKGKVIFLSFFGYNCPPCKREIPEFIKMKEKYGEDLEILAIEIRGLKEKRLESFIKSKNINYPVVAFTKEAEKFAYHTAQKAEWRGAIPFLIVLDREGEVKFLQTGLIPYKILEIAFQKVK